MHCEIKIWVAGAARAGKCSPVVVSRAVLRKDLKTGCLKTTVTFCHKGGVIYISEVIEISPGNLYSNCASSPAFLMMYSA